MTGGATAYLVVGIAKIQLPQPSLAGTWAELGNMKIFVNASLRDNSTKWVTFV